MKWISPEQCKTILENSTAELIDVREPWEYDICRIASVNVPMHAITGEVERFDKEKPYIIVCKTGRRAEAVANLLEREHGFADISILEGGITAWYAFTDPSFELY